MAGGGPRVPPAGHSVLTLVLWVGGGWRRSSCSGLLFPISVVLPKGRERDVPGCLPAPDQASTQPSLMALFFVCAAQQLALPPPGGVTALGATQSPEPGEVLGPGSRNDLGILLDPGSGSWAIRACLGTRNDPSTYWAMPGQREGGSDRGQTESGRSSAPADPSGHSWCKTLFLQPQHHPQAPGLPPASGTAMPTTPRSWSAALGQGLARG